MLLPSLFCSTYIDCICLLVIIWVLPSRFLGPLRVGNVDAAEVLVMLIQCGEIFRMNAGGIWLKAICLCSLAAKELIKVEFLFSTSCGQRIVALMNW